MKKKSKGKGWQGDPEGHARAGSLGGTMTASEHGPAFYKKIGRMGGLATLVRHGLKFYKKIGRKGAQGRLGTKNWR